MEYCFYGDLSQFQDNLKSKGQSLEPMEIVYIVKELLEGLALL
jgi:serine/threonine protein kinase